MKDHVCVQALGVHTQASTKGDTEASEAVFAALQCLHSLMTTSTAGMEAVLSARNFLERLCEVLGTENTGNPEASKLAVDMLMILCRYDNKGYYLGHQGQKTLP